MDTISTSRFMTGLRGVFVPKAGDKDHLGFMAALTRNEEYRSPYRSPIFQQGTSRWNRKRSRNRWQWLKACVFFCSSKTVGSDIGPALLSAAN
jgi:hypothetical protein